MSDGFTFVGSVVPHQYVGLVSAGVVLGAACLVASKARRSIQHALNNSSVDKSLTANAVLLPEDKLTARGIYELLGSFILQLGDNVMGKENRKFLPFVAALFTYIFFLNLLGLVPGFIAPTHALTFNLGVALVVFVAYNAWGVREHGVLAYLKHFCGPVWWMAPLLFVIEIVSHVVRPISLSLRLFGNMTGDHLVLGIFTQLTQYIIPVIFYFLGLFVCFMQAFVFTLLTMVYIRFSVAHEHSEDGQGGHH